MKKIDVGQTVTILANAGVIAGILLLAYELRQNNELMEAEARFNRLSLITEAQGALVDNPDLAELFVKLSNGDDLTQGEGVRLRSYFQMVFRNQEWQYREVPESLLSVQTWRRNANDFRRTVWEERKAEFDPDFVQFMDENVYSH